MLNTLTPTHTDDQSTATRALSRSIVAFLVALALHWIGSPQDSRAAMLNRIPQANLAALDGLATDSFTVSGVTYQGVTADLTFTFSTSSGLFETGSNGNRLGVDSPSNQGTEGSNHINEGETVTIDVSASITNLALGRVVDALNFGITKVDLTRAGPNSNGNIRYTWTSSAATYTSTPTTVTGPQNANNERLDNTSRFDILNTNYSGTFDVDENGDPNVVGYRIPVDIDNFEFSFEPDITYQNVVALYDFAAGGNGQNFNQVGNDPGLTGDHVTVTRLSTNGLDGGGSNDILEESDAKFDGIGDSGSPVANWGNAQAATPTNYAEFTVTPDAGFETTYDAISLWHRSFDGSGKFAISYLDGFGPEMFVLTGEPQTTGDALFTEVDFANFTSSNVVTWRLYSYAASNADAGQRFDDILLIGSTTAIASEATGTPEPASVVLGLIGLVSLKLFPLRRSRQRRSLRL